MPEMSSVRTFVEALKTGMTKTTKALDQVDYAEYIDQLKVPGALNALQPWAREALTAQGLSEGELGHINAWPNDQKELIRQAIVNAVDNARNLSFFWELYANAEEDTSIQGLDEEGDITITFLSPRRRVTTSGNLSGGINVGVGRPGS